MASSADRWACDTSVAIASLDPAHEAHAACREVVLDRRPALAGHAAFETYSVLTRLPAPLRLSPAQAGDVLARAFPHWCWPDHDSAGELRRLLVRCQIAGGSVYDALVGWSAVADDRVLLTGDRRALRTYERVGAAYQHVT